MVGEAIHVWGQGQYGNSLYFLLYFAVNSKNAVKKNCIHKTKQPTKARPRNLTDPGISANPKQNKHKKITPNHTTINLMKTKGKEKSLKCQRKKKKTYYALGKNNRHNSQFLMRNYNGIRKPEDHRTISLQY